MLAADSPRAGRLRLGALALAGAALTLAGCSSSSNDKADSASTSPVAPTTSAPTPSPTTSTGLVTGAPASTTSGPSRCHTSQLSASIANSGGAAGHIVGYVVFTNTGGVTCEMYGYPGLGLLDGSGHVITISVVRGGGMGQETTAQKTTVTLAPNAVAHAEYNYTDVPSGSQTTCPTAAKLQVTPPDETTSLVVAAQLAPCGGVIHIGPVIAGPPPSN